MLPYNTIACATSAVCGFSVAPLLICTAWGRAYSAKSICDRLTLWDCSNMLLYYSFSRWLFIFQIKELQSCLEMEKEKVLRLEETVSDLGSKHSNDQKDLYSLHNKLIGLENDLKQAIQEKSIHEETLKERLCQTKKLLKSLKKYQDAAVQKVLCTNNRLIYTWLISRSRFDFVTWKNLNVPPNLL